MAIEVALVVNNERVTRRVPDSQLLCDFLRDDLGLIGTRVGCNEGVCGACTVIVDGHEVRSCLMLAAQADGTNIRTVEGLASGDGLSPLQRAFVDHGALQCGFCTSGFLMTATVLLEVNPRPTNDEIRQALEGNICRCTGYQKIVEAIASVAAGAEGR